MRSWTNTKRGDHGQLEIKRHLDTEDVVAWMKERKERKLLRKPATKEWRTRGGGLSNTTYVHCVPGITIGFPVMKVGIETGKIKLPFEK